MGSPRGLSELRWTTVGDGAGLARKVADQLAQAIITGELQGGARLAEQEIAEAFGISRTPAREALYILERESLVDRAPRKETTVSRVTAQQAFDVYVCLAFLYGLSAKLAAKQISEATLTDLADVVGKMQATVEAEDHHAYFELNARFYQLVGSATGNQELLKLMIGLGGHTTRFRYMSMTIPGRIRISAHRNAQILRLLREGDGAGAEVEVRQLVADAGASVLSHFFEDPEKAGLLVQVVTKL